MKPLSVPKQFALASLSAAMAPAVLAQTSEPTRLDTVEVTAQKRAQPLADVPLSMQAFRGETLRESGITELGELLRFVPGASEGISNSYGYKTYQIRGTGVVTGDATVAYYIDDVAFSLIGSNIAPVGRTFDVERVEVLRGPQGTLYGLSALGGAVRFITANPDLYKFSGKGQVGFSGASGGDKGHYVDAAVSVPIIEGKLGARLSVDVERKGGYVEVTDFPDRKNLDPTRIQNFRGKLLWEPTQNARATLTMQHNEVKQDFGTLLVDNDPPTGTQGSNEALAGITTKYDMAALAFSIDLGAVTLESSTGYLKFNLDQTAYINVGGPVKAVQLSEQPTLTQEVRLVSNPGSAFDWVAGGFYKRARGDAQFDLTGAITVSLPSKTSSDSYAAFTEVSTKFMDGKLTPLVGLRYSVDERETEAGGGKQSATYKAFTPRFNLSYMPDRTTNYYTNIARGVRSGLFNNPALVPIAQGLGVPAREVVDKDSLWSYEVGTKGELMGGRVGYNLALYRTHWKDVQIIVTPAPGLGVTLNAGKAVGTGLDYGVSAEVVRGLTLALSGNYNDTKLRDLPDAVANSSPSDGLYNGARMPYVPRTTNSVSATVDLPWKADWRFVGFAAYSRTGGQNQANSGLTSDPVEMVSARFGVRRKALEVIVFADNLLDKSPRTYREFGLVNRPYPRTVGVQLAGEF